MLTPAAHDPDRKAQLKRAAADPNSFGAAPVTENIQRNLSTNGGLARAAEDAAPVEQKAAKPAEPEAPAPTAEEVEAARLAAEEVEAARLAAEEAAKLRAGWADYLDQPVVDLIAELSTVQDVAQLEAMSAVEAEIKNRKTLIEAIAAEIAKRDEAN